MFQLRGAPAGILFATLFLCLLSLLISVRFATHRQPWLGVSLQAQGESPGALITRVYPNSPASLILSPNDSITTLGSVSGKAQTILASDLAEDPDVFPTFGAYHDFLARQSLFTAILREPVVIVTLEDGREVRLQPRASRPVGALPVKFWFLNAIGIVSCLLGAGIFSVRLTDRPAQVYGVAGIGLLIGTMAVAVIASRELALAPGLYAGPADRLPSRQQYLCAFCGISSRALSLAVEIPSAALAGSVADAAVSGERILRVDRSAREYRTAPGTDLYGSISGSGFSPESRC